MWKGIDTEAIKRFIAWQFNESCAVGGGVAGRCKDKQTSDPEAKWLTGQ